MFEHDQQMDQLRLLKDDMEKRESEYAHLTREEQMLSAELESLNERKKNMQLINDQVGGWLKRVGAKMQDQLNGMQMPGLNEKSTVEVLRDLTDLAKSQLATIKQRQ